MSHRLKESLEEHCKTEQARSLTILGTIFRLSLGSAPSENGQPAARNVKQRGFSRILDIGFAFVKSGDKPAASLLRLWCDSLIFTTCP
jgi:hypothetical protein